MGQGIRGCFTFLIVSWLVIWGAVALWFVYAAFIERSINLNIPSAFIVARFVRIVLVFGIPLLILWAIRRSIRDDFGLSKSVKEDLKEQKKEPILCSNCGKYVEQGVSFCPHCGNNMNPGV